MSIKLALIGNPNSGKTTIFNALTGSNQYVGNWPGVTVEKKEGKLKKAHDVTLVDLPGIYSLSPYTMEEVISRDYLLHDNPDAIINIVDASNIERNLYLTTQLLELGIPVLVVLNMMDVVKKLGIQIDAAKLSKALGCPVVEVSATKGYGVTTAAHQAVELAKKNTILVSKFAFDGQVEQALSRIQNLLPADIAPLQKRWFAIKLFERDAKVTERMPLNVESIVQSVERNLNDDSESIITNERYQVITTLLATCMERNSGEMTLSDKIDSVLTNRFLAFPIFAVIMFALYYVSVTTVGSVATHWANDGLFGEGWNLGSLYIPGIPTIVEGLLTALGTADWLNALILDGIIGGVGAVLGFVPQMLMLFFLLALLELCGYMSRVAFIMDRLFRKFGLSGKAFIPMLIGSGCGVPGIMASRTIENESDRRMTIITTTFIPCGAKMPIVALIAGTLFGGEWWVAPSAYFVGVAAVVISGIILKKTKAFSSDPSPFIMELPQYHLPTLQNLFHVMWERSWSFIKKAGSIILVSSIGIWFLASFGFVDGNFGMVEDISHSMIAVAGGWIAPVFTPLGFGTWEATVATLMGLVAKEEVVSVFGVLYGVSGDALEILQDGTFGSLGAISSHFTMLSGYAFLVFNLLCAPCFAAIGAIRREMASTKWTIFAILYQTVLAYIAALCLYQFGQWAFHGVFGMGTVVAIASVCTIGYLLVRKPYQAPVNTTKGVSM